MPAAYAIHICEEWFGGFPRYVVEKMHGFPMPEPLFFLNNGIFMAILLSLCAWASRSQSPVAAFLLLSWASANLFWNFFVHLLFTVTTTTFSPGLVTGALLYYPLPPVVAALAVRERRASLANVMVAFAIGLLLMAFVIWGGVYHFAVAL